MSESALFFSIDEGSWVWGNSPRFGNAGDAYLYTQCGSERVWLENGYSIVPEVEITRLVFDKVDELHVAIAEALGDSGLLSFKEARFILNELKLLEAVVSGGGYNLRATYSTIGRCFVGHVAEFGQKSEFRARSFSGLKDAFRKAIERSIAEEAARLLRPEPSMSEVRWRRRRQARP